MTTGRINQVANPLFVASWPPRGVGQPAAELQRSALPLGEGGPWTVVRLLGLVGPWKQDGAEDGLPFPSNEGGLSVVVLGTARSLRTPLGHDFCEPTGQRV